VTQFELNCLSGRRIAGLHPLAGPADVPRRGQRRRHHPGVDIRGVLDTSFTRVPADAEGKVPTGYGHWCNAWPPNPGWRFVAVGIGHDVDYWTEFLRALAEIDPNMAVNIEHEDADYDRLPGLVLAADNLRTAAAKL